MAKWLNGKVVANNRWNERLTSLKFEAPLENFESGQFVRVGLEIDGDVVARPYSLVNTPDESALEIYFNIVTEGPLSPRLFELETGDDIMVAIRPAGFLTSNSPGLCGVKYRLLLLWIRRWLKASSVSMFGKQV